MAARRLLLPLLALVLLAAACGGDDGASEEADAGNTTTTVGEPVDGGTMTFAVEAESDGYNPVANRWSISGNLIGSAVYETLTVVTPDGGVEPWLAESLEPDEDGTEWLITAREGVTFHDGTPLDAEVIAANLQARKDGVLTSQANEPIESIDVVDDRTVRVTMSSPWRAWNHALASQSGYMMSMTNIEDPEADPIGTGPFTWAEHVVDESITLERYDDYWRDGLPHLDTLEFRIIVDEQSREQTLRSGGIDAMLTETPQTIAELRDSELTVIEDSSDTHVIMMNSAVPPFDDPVAREALIAATDREELVETLYDGETEVANGPFAMERWRAEESTYPGHDPERAEELLAQYEEENGEPLSFTVQSSQGQDDAQRLAALAAQWEEAGIEVEQEQLEQSSFIGGIVAGEYQAAHFRNFSWADPDFNYLFWHSDNAKGVGDISINFTQTVNPELDAALERGRASADPEEREEAYDEVQRILDEELSHVWLFHSLWAIVSQPDVHGWQEAAERGFSRQDAKIFWADLWLEP